MLNSCRFYISKEDFGEHSIYKLQDQKTGEYVCILPHLGGSVNNLMLQLNNKLVDVIDGYKSEEDSNENLFSSFKGSNLYPFPNRIEGGRYRFKEQDFQFECNFPDENNAIHGLMFNQPFDVIAKEDGDIGCTLILRYIVKEHLEVYPYKNMIEVDYRWSEDNQFECITKITNLSDDSMPVGHGWHPYFCVDDLPIDDLDIQFPSREIMIVTDKGIPTGETKDYKDFNSLNRLGETKFDDCFILESDNNEADIIIKSKKNNISYTIWQQTGIHKYNYLQVYTPPSRKSIAFEPMTCSPNAFNNGNGLIILGPQERISLKWGVKSNQ